ncbi:hypothetical protein WJX84_009536 [Apatococcus fuscideae]|uniref:E3 ubiquitin-protein ligase CHFR n=1 Tax=Apatococcus fuscideae TaxID=2026836 RepID=A0AAW1S2A3_9CHLO
MAAPFCIEVSQILKTGRTVTFGRSPDSNVPLQSLEFPLLASRTHAELRLRGSHLFIRDLKSTNGTFVQDVRVAAEQLLQDEAIITFGGPRKVINQASSCPNPFSFKLVVHQLGINVLPAQVMISSFTPNIAETSKPMPAALPPPQQPPPPPPPSRQPIPQPDAVIDLTGAADTSSPIGVASQAPRLPRRTSAKRSTGNAAKPMGPKKQRQDDAVQLVEEVQMPVPPPSKPAEVEKKAAQDHLAAMEEQFECAVCKDWLVAPFSVHPCGHLLCGDCLRQWLEKSKTCPCCRAKCTAPPARAIAVENLILQLVEPNLGSNEVKLRKQQKAVWDKKSAGVIKQWQKDLTPAARASAHPADAIGSHAAGTWSGIADAFMSIPGAGRWFAMGGPPPELAMQTARRSAGPAMGAQYRVEYASHSTGRCHRCHGPTIAASLRIGTLQRGGRGEPQWKWFHPPCLPSDLRNPARNVVHGLGSINAHDRAEVRSILHI